jgi:hypothetical protein
MCLTDDPTSGCLDPSLDPMETDCQEECHAGEYGFACGVIGQGPFQPATPAGCRVVGGTPTVLLFYCCPCGA